MRWRSAAGLGQDDPQDDVDQLANAHQSEDDETDPDKPRGQAESGCDSRADSGYQFAVTGTYQCASHAATLRRSGTRRNPALQTSRAFYRPVASVTKVSEAGPRSTGQ